MTKRRLAMEKLLTVEPKVRALAEPKVRAGAVRSMGLSLERLNEGAEGDRVVELDPALCEPSFVRDRLEDVRDGEGERKGDDPAGIAALADSILEGGQVVPILVRPMPGAAGRYQIAYGHRRWLACRRLGRTVRAVVRPLADEDLVIAQGRENNERRDLSFIERAHFAARLVERGLSRAVVCKALGIDKSELARLLAVANGLPEGLAELIGRAPKAGRPRWMTLVSLCEGANAQTAIAVARQSMALDTDARFRAVLAALDAAPAQPAPRRTRTARTGFPGRVEVGGGTTRITVEDAGKDGFGAFLAGELDRLYAAYLKRRG